MDQNSNAQTLGEQETVASLDREFALLHEQAAAIIEKTPVTLLYAVSASEAASSASAGPQAVASVGECVLRYAAAIEQTFGGLTANLWDDPFEWTLPEYLSTPAKVKEYLDEVEATRRRAFSSFTDDACLKKHVAVPSGETRPLIDLLQETLLRANDWQAQALFALKTLSVNSPPGFII